jgi:hypothetical protein
MQRTTPVVATVLMAAATSGFATPDPTDVVFHFGVYNDCPSSTVSAANSYPSTVWIQDAGLDCSPGFANRHNWRLSEDGATDAVFNNADSFAIAADLVVNRTSDEGYAGLNVSPWWSQEVDGSCLVGTATGEVACFGGRLPFYSFTDSNGLHYVAGTVIRLEMRYLPNGLSAAAPGTMQYTVTYGGTTYTSGPLPFDEGIGGEMHGTWGILDDARVGGFVMPFLNPGEPGATVEATWSNLQYLNLCAPPELPNLLANPYFDSDLGGWFETAADHATFMWTVYDRYADPDSGSAYLASSWPDPYVLVSLCQCLRVVPGARLWTSGDAYIPGPQPVEPATVLLLTYMIGGTTCVDGTSAYRASPLNDLHDGWWTMEVSDTVPDDTHWMWFEVGLYKESAGGQIWAYFDQTSVSTDGLSGDGFESGDTTFWTLAEP